MQYLRLLGLVILLVVTVDGAYGMEKERPQGPCGERKRGRDQEQVEKAVAKPLTIKQAKQRAERAGEAGVEPVAVAVQLQEAKDAIRHYV